MQTSTLRVVLAVAALGLFAQPSAAKTVNVTIRFIPPSSDGVDAKCEAVTSVPHLKVAKGDKIKWKIKKDEDNGCVDLDADFVKLDFGTSGYVDDDNASPSQYVMGHSHVFGSDKAEGTAVKATTTKIKYKIYLNDKLAQDPELEITGY